MESILRSKKMDDLTYFFPVRHHSPACSYHLSKVCEEFQPDAILVEGPWDANALIPNVGHIENQAPIAIYYSYTHLVESGEEPYKSGCYFPFLDYSPELVAIRYAIEKELFCSFIDLPYSEIAMMKQEHNKVRENHKKTSYYDDYYLQRSKYVGRLCEKEGCRNYGELWEKLFELQGIQMETEEFIYALLAFCHYARDGYPAKLLEEEGCLQREQHMAEKIKECQKKHKRILVVTGGFHTAALQMLIQEDVVPYSLRSGKGEAYLIPYSFAESDQLEGYESGMPFPGFYQEVYGHLQREPSTAYNKAVLMYCAKIGNALRNQKESISIADEMAAYTQSAGLASLRDKPQQGVYELLDGITSAYKKGEADVRSSLVDAVSTEILQGDGIGKIGTKVNQIPILLDFFMFSKKYRLKIEQSVDTEVVLELLSRPRHRKVSAFFHQLRYLQIGFAECRFGPDYENRDSKRVREKWEYRMTAKVQSALVDVSYLGQTIKEAALHTLLLESKGRYGCAEYTRLLIDGMVMDMANEITPLFHKAEEVVVFDGNITSLVQGLKNLLFLEGMQWLYNIEQHEFFNELLYGIYQKSIALLPAVHTKREDEDLEMAMALKDLYEVAQRDGEEGKLFFEALEKLCLNNEVPPSMQGSAAGLLYANGSDDGWSAETVFTLAESYMFGTKEKMKLSGRFLSGVFLSAWDIVFEHHAFLLGLNHVFTVLETEEFLEMLPDLRFAFSRFTPGQIHRIGEHVADVLGLSTDQVIAESVPEELLLLGRRLDAYAVEGGFKSGR